MNVFLTGSSGFVGSGVLSHMLANDMAVTTMVRRELVGMCQGIEVVVADLDNIDALDGTVFKEIDVVVHAAARAHIKSGSGDVALEEYLKINRDATLTLARKAAAAGVKRFVFLSTIGVNGSSTINPFTESDTPHPHDAYSLSKYGAEVGLLALAHETGMEVVIIRPPLVYGLNAPGSFATMLRWIRKGIPLPFALVRNLRSFVGLDNLVDFVTLCADRKRSPRAANQIFLISDCEDVSTTQLIYKIAGAAGVKIRIFPAPVGLMRFVAKFIGKRALGDSLFSSLQVDSSKARDLLGWAAPFCMDDELCRSFSSLNSVD